MLSIKNLHASVEGKEILKGINLEIKAGEVHAIMGPNGSGKSTLSQVLAGNEAFEVTEGEITLNGDNLLELETEERAREGIFLAFQYPVEIPGVSNLQFLRTAVNAMRQHKGQDEMNAAEFMKLAKEISKQVDLDPAVAFFIGERIRSNVRELEGALRRVIANARFTGSRISIEQVKRALRDLLAIQDRQVGIDNIQRTVAEYYNIKISDMLSKRRNRTIARPRQVAMTLAKDLTNHSLPEIGEAFGGRDHTTVLHACKKIAELRESTAEIAEDYKNLNRLLGV